MNICEQVLADVKYETPYRQIYPIHKEEHWKALTEYELGTHRKTWGQAAAVDTGGQL